MGQDEAFARRMEALRLLMAALDTLDGDEDTFTCTYVSAAIDILEKSMRGGTLGTLFHRRKLDR